MNCSSGDMLCNRYQLITKIGIGGFSDVWKANDTLARMVVVLKIFVRQDEQGIRLCRDEYQRLVSLNHPHIVRMLSLEVHHQMPMLVMPYFPGGSAAALIGRIDEAEAVRMIAQIASALDYIHNLSKPVVHNDIKPDNLLLDLYSNYALTDFGISEQLTDRFTKSVGSDRMSKSKNNARHGVTPMSYRAPELFNYRNVRRQTPNERTDIWSFGASMYEMMAGEPPFAGDGGFFLLVNDKIGHDLDDVMPVMPPHFSFGLVSLVKACLHLDPYKRLTAKQLKGAAEFWLAHREWPPLPEDKTSGQSAPKPVSHSRMITLAKTIGAYFPQKKQHQLQVDRKTSNNIMFSFFLKFALILIPAVGVLVYFYNQHKVHLKNGDTFFEAGNYMEATKEYHEASSLPWVIESIKPKIWLCKFLHRLQRQNLTKTQGFYSGMAAVKNKDGKHGFVDSTGTLKIGAIYDSVYQFHEGKAIVFAGKWRHEIDSIGNKISTQKIKNNSINRK